MIEDNNVSDSKLELHGQYKTSWLVHRYECSARPGECSAGLARSSKLLNQYQS